MAEAEAAVVAADDGFGGSTTRRLRMDGGVSASTTDVRLIARSMSMIGMSEKSRMHELKSIARSLSRSCSTTEKKKKNPESGTRIK